MQGDSRDAGHSCRQEERARSPPHSDLISQKIQIGGKDKWHTIKQEKNIDGTSGKQRKRSMVTASGFFIIPPRSDAVTIAAPNTTCPPSGPQVSIATPYPIHTPAKMTGKKCPPFKPN